MNQKITYKFNCKYTKGIVLEQHEQIDRARLSQAQISKIAQRKNTETNDFSPKFSSLAGTYVSVGQLRRARFERILSPTNLLQGAGWNFHQCYLFPCRGEVPSPHKLPTAAHNRCRELVGDALPIQEPEAPRVTNAVKSRIEDLECSKDGELNSSTQIWLTISHLTWMKNSSFGKVRESVRLPFLRCSQNGIAKRVRKREVKWYLYPHLKSSHYRKNRKLRIETGNSAMKEKRHNGQLLSDFPV